jgi:hypothetical protein
VGLFIKIPVLFKTDCYAGEQVQESRRRAKYTLPTHTDQVIRKWKPGHHSLIVANFSPLHWQRPRQLQAKRRLLSQNPLRTDIPTHALNSSTRDSAPS